VARDKGFRLASRFERWSNATCHPMRQDQLIELLEDCAEDVEAPEPVALVNLLRTLRATSSAAATTELRPDGTTSVRYEHTTGVRTGSAGEVELPSHLALLIPVLDGHTERWESDGEHHDRPVLYRVSVRLRVSVQTDAKLAFRLSLPNHERLVEDAVADCVAIARAALGENLGATLLRAV
jgi:hypothetical protein